MLPKKRRIPRSFFDLLLKAKSFSNDLVILRTTHYDSVNSRFAVSISKKVAKKANIRNKMRRLGYRIISENLNSIKPNLLAQLVWKRIATTKEEAYAKIKELLKKIQK